MIKAVLFDIDGTLINSLGNYLEAYTKTLNYYGFKLSNEEIVDRCFGHTEEAICEELGISQKTEEFRDLYFNNVKKGLQKVKLFPDTIYTLGKLKREKAQVGFITFAKNWYVKEISDLFRLNQYAQLEIGFDDVINSKPNPEAVNKACKFFRIENNEALIVGDSKSDILMGKNAGSKTALYTPEENKIYYNFDELIKSNPNFIVKSLKDILNLIT